MFVRNYVFIIALKRLKSIYIFVRGRSRHVDHEFDLDLTYITDRIIGKLAIMNIACT